MRRWPGGRDPDRCILLAMGLPMVVMVDCVMIKMMMMKKKKSFGHMQNGRERCLRE